MGGIEEITRAEERGAAACGVRIVPRENPTARLIPGVYKAVLTPPSGPSLARLCPKLFSRVKQQRDAGVPPVTRFRIPPILHGEESLPGKGILLLGLDAMRIALAIVLTSSPQFRAVGVCGHGRRTARTRSKHGSS